MTAIKLTPCKQLGSKSIILVDIEQNNKERLHNFPDQTHC